MAKPYTSVTWNKQPLLSPDAQFKLTRQLGRTFDVSRINVLRSPHQFLSSGRQRPRNWEATPWDGKTLYPFARQTEKYRVGASVPNYPPPPPPKLNTLYIPTGATRWAEGYFLMGGEEFRAAVNESPSFALYGSEYLPSFYRGALDVSVKDDHYKKSEQDCFFSYYLYCVAAIPLFAHTRNRSWAVPEVAAGLGHYLEQDEVYLICLTDTRFFWQGHDLGNLHWPTGTPFDVPLRQIEHELEGVFGDNIQWDSGLPYGNTGFNVDLWQNTISDVFAKSDGSGGNVCIDAEEMNRSRENSAVLMEHLLTSCGLRLCPNPVGANEFKTDDGTIDKNHYVITSLQTSSQQGLGDGNVDDGSLVLAGGEYMRTGGAAALIPSEVDVTFPKFYKTIGSKTGTEHGIPHDEGDFYTVSVNTSGLTLYDNHSTVSTLANAGAGFSKTIFSSAEAIMGGNMFAEEAPSNAAALSTLAVELATHYVNQHVVGYDVSAAIVDSDYYNQSHLALINFTVWDDNITLYLAAQDTYNALECVPIEAQGDNAAAPDSIDFDSTARYQFYVRRQSLPANFGWSEVTHGWDETSSSSSSSSTEEEPFLECIDVVIDVLADNAACELQLDKAQICFPTHLGVQISNPYPIDKHIDMATMICSCCDEGGEQSSSSSSSSCSSTQTPVPDPPQECGENSCEFMWWKWDTTDCDQHYWVLWSDGCGGGCSCPDEPDYTPVCDGSPGIVRASVYCNNDAFSTSSSSCSSTVAELPSNCYDCKCNWTWRPRYYAGGLGYIPGDWFYNMFENDGPPLFTNCFLSRQCAPVTHYHVINGTFDYECTCPDIDSVLGPQPDPTKAGYTGPETRTVGGRIHAYTICDTVVGEPSSSSSCSSTNTAGESTSSSSSCSSTSSSSSCSSTATGAAGPCGQCRFRWDDFGTFWEEMEDACIYTIDNCQCEEPPYSGNYHGEEVWENCQGSG